MADNNIKKYRKPLNINIGMVFFLIIMIYILICTVMYFTSKHVIGYEVMTGSLSVSNVYEGIAIREETIVTSTGSGYVNYYAREGEKVGCGNVICSIDETGQLKDMMTKEAQDGNSILSSQDYSEIKADFTDFATTYDNSNFQTAYDFKYAIESSVLKYSNRNLLKNLSELTDQSNAGLISLCNSPASGIVIYSIDGYEDVKAEEVKKEWFDKSGYEKTQLINNEIVDVGDPIYKLTNKEEWSIIIPVEKDRIEELVEEEYVRVKFLKNQCESWGRVEALNGADGETYIQLFFNNSMVTFATDRYVNIELITDVESGLKVPNSAIIEKEFFLVPTEYVTKSGTNVTDCVLREVYSEDGTMSTEALPVTIYNEADGEYYVDDDSLRIGDRILKPDSTDEFTISKVANLIGVYNINKGYADFKQIQILNQNDEYSIIKSNTMYGLVAYDYIVLDAESVEVDEFIYD